jgi:hypothetical protein
MDNLRIFLKKINNPYSYEESSEYDLWGQIEIYYSEKILIDTQWNVLPFIEWFNSNFEKLNTEIFPFRLNNSIAETRDVLYNKNDFANEQEEDLYYKNLENYFSRHFLKIKGTDTNIFYIGLIDNNIGEISFCKNKIYYSYYFAMDNFINQTKNEINTFILSYN